MISRRHFLATSAAAALLPATARSAGPPLPIFDAHIHFSHDAAERFTAGEAVAILERAGLKRALVSSSGDAGTRALHAAAPDLALPSLRPYRRRGEIGSWVDDPSVIDFLEDRVNRFKWVAVGEFHLFTGQTDKAVPRRMIELARQHNLLLHAHSDAGAVDAIFAQWPEARVLWAHAGFVGPDTVGPMLGKHANLWTDLAFRSEHAYRRPGRRGLAEPLHRLPGPGHGRHRHLHAGALALCRRARRLDPAMARRPAARSRREDRLAQRRGDDPAAPRATAARQPR